MKGKKGSGGRSQDVKSEAQKPEELDISRSVGSGSGREEEAFAQEKKGDGSPKTPLSREPSVSPENEVRDLKSSSESGSFGSPSLRNIDAAVEDVTRLAQEFEELSEESSQSSAMNPVAPYTVDNGEFSSVVSSSRVDAQPLENVDVPLYDTDDSDVSDDSEESSELGGDGKSWAPTRIVNGDDSTTVSNANSAKSTLRGEQDQPTVVVAEIPPSEGQKISSAELAAVDLTLGRKDTLAFDVKKKSELDDILTPDVITEAQKNTQKQEEQSFLNIDDSPNVEEQQATPVSGRKAFVTTTENEYDSSTSKEQFLKSDKKGEKENMSRSRSGSEDGKSVEIVRDVATTPPPLPEKTEEVILRGEALARENAEKAVRVEERGETLRRSYERKRTGNNENSDSEDKFSELGETSQAVRVARKVKALGLEKKDNIVVENVPVQNDEKTVDRARRSPSKSPISSGLAAVKDKSTSESYDEEGQAYDSSEEDSAELSSYEENSSASYRKSEKTKVANLSGGMPNKDKGEESQKGAAGVVIQSLENNEGTDIILRSEGAAATYDDGLKVGYEIEAAYKKDSSKPVVLRIADGTQGVDPVLAGALDYLEEIKSGAKFEIDLGDGTDYTGKKVSEGKAGDVQTGVKKLEGIEPYFPTQNLDVIPQNPQAYKLPPSAVVFDGLGQKQGDGSSTVSSTVTPSLQIKLNEGKANAERNKNVEASDTSSKDGRTTPPVRKVKFEGDAPGPKDEGDDGEGKGEPLTKKRKNTPQEDARERRSAAGYAFLGAMKPDGVDIALTAAMTIGVFFWPLLAAAAGLLVVKKLVNGASAAYEAHKNKKADQLARVEGEGVEVDQALGKAIDGQEKGPQTAKELSEAFAGDVGGGFQAKRNFNKFLQDAGIVSSKQGPGMDESVRNDFVEAAVKAAKDANGGNLDIANRRDMRLLNRAAAELIQGDHEAGKENGFAHDHNGKFAQQVISRGDYTKHDVRMAGKDFREQQHKERAQERADRRAERSDRLLEKAKDRADASAERRRDAKESLQDAVATVKQAPKSLAGSIKEGVDGLHDSHKKFAERQKEVRKYKKELREDPSKASSRVTASVGKPDGMNVGENAIHARTTTVGGKGSEIEL